MIFQKDRMLPVETVYFTYNPLSAILIDVSKLKWYFLVKIGVSNRDERTREHLFANNRVLVREQEQNENIEKFEKREQEQNANKIFVLFFQIKCLVLGLSVQENMSLICKGLKVNGRAKVDWGLT